MSTQLSTSAPPPLHSCAKLCAALCACSNHLSFGPTPWLECVQCIWTSAYIHVHSTPHIYSNPFAKLCTNMCSNVLPHLCILVTSLVNNQVLPLIRDDVSDQRLYFQLNVIPPIRAEIYGHSWPPLIRGKYPLP